MSDANVSKPNSTKHDAFGPPRVLMFVPQYPYPVVGGLERQSHELSKALRELGVEVQVLSGKITPEHPDFEWVEGVAVTRLLWPSWKPLRFLRAPFDVLFALWGMRGNYDVIHLHQHSWVGLFVILLAKLIGKPVITKLPNVGDYGIPGIKAQSLGWLRLSILLKSDAIIAMSQVSVAELLEVGYSLRRILTVPNGIKRLPPLESKYNRHGTGGNRCKIVFVGRLEKQKNLDVLLTAWSKIQKRIRDEAYIELWGEGTEDAYLKQMCLDLQIRDSVVFAGRIHNVRERLRDMDVFVLPSTTEGNSNAILEAMEAGLPIVSTPVGGTPMQVGPVGTPLLFPVGDADQLAERLMSLVRNASQRQYYGDAMGQRVETYFDIQKVAMSYLNAYRVLASGQVCNMTNCAELPEG